ncbi:hypothetical protein ACF0H5_018459 [Mactra antiquata]
MMACLNDSRISIGSRGGDELIEMFCEQCKELDNKDETAIAYCNNCHEYFCENCKKYYHRRTYKDAHKMLHNEEMPKDFCQDFCTIHPNLLIKFYCEAHKKSACKECIKSNHVSCQEVKYIPDLVNGINQSYELLNIIQELKQLSEDLKLMMEIMPSDERINTTKEEACKAMNNRQEALKKQMEDQWSTTVQKLDEKAKIAINNHTTQYNKDKDDLKKEYQTKLEKLENDYQNTQEEITELNHQEKQETLKKLKVQQEKLIQKHAEEERKLANDIEKRSNHDKDKMKKNYQQTKKVLEDVQRIENEIQHKRVRNQKCGLFLTMKNAAERIEGLTYMASQVQAQNHMNNYIFESGENINPHIDFDVVDIAFGTLREKSTQKRSVKAIAKIKISHEGDDKGRISGICQLSASHLVAVDSIHNQLKLVDITENKVVMSHPLGNSKSKPFDVTKVNENMVAVTFPREGTIKFLEILVDRHQIVMTREINVGVGCHGILYRWGQLIVSYTETPRVEIMDLKGKMYQKFEKDDRGKVLFESPLYIAQGLYDRTIYVSDYQKATIVRLSCSGKSQNNIEVNLKSVCSMGITVDLQDTVYVLDGGSIHQLSSDLSSSHHLKSHQDQQVNHLGLFYSIKNNKLFEARWGILQIYDIS